MPCPARVDTTPADVILRTHLFPLSETYKFPDESTTISKGPLNLALVPDPFR